MAADEFGNDVQAVGIPVTGNIGFAPFGTTVPTPAAGGALDFILPEAFKVAGLLTEDGGFEWTLEADGDPTVFYQEGYSLPSGMANALIKVKFAQTDETVRGIIRGKTADANGYMTIDAGGTDKKYVLFTEEVFKNGVIRRRVGANVSVKSVKEDKSERGKVIGYDVEFKLDRHASTENNHLGEWLLQPGGLLSITGATPTEAATAATVTITGVGFTGATGVKFASTNATEFAVVSDTELTAVLPTGSAGSAQITVTTPLGTATFPYQRGA